MSDSSVLDLQKYRWKNRLLLLGSTSDNDLIERQKGFYSRSQGGNDERQLLLVSVDQTQSTLIEKYGFKESSFKMLLIGKDGGVKAEYTQPTPMTEIYSTIDAMPMRQQEMRGENP